MSDKQLEFNLDELDKEFEVTTSQERDLQERSGNFGHKGRPGHQGGSAPSGGMGYRQEDKLVRDIHDIRQAQKNPPEGGFLDVDQPGMSDKDVIKVAKKSLKTMANNVHQWSVRDSLMTIANDFLGTDYVALGGESGTATAKHLAQQLSRLPDDQILALYDKYYESLGMWSHESDPLDIIDTEFGIIKIGEGGKGSGDFGHSGRPGQVGGSGSGGSTQVSTGTTKAPPKGFKSGSYKGLRLSRPKYDPTARSGGGHHVTAWDQKVSKSGSKGEGIVLFVPANKGNSWSSIFDAHTEPKGYGPLGGGSFKTADEAYDDLVALFSKY